MTVAELINELQNYPSHNPVRILDEDTDETVGIEKIFQNYNTDDKVVVIIKPYYVM